MDNIIQEAYARLQALKANAPNQTEVPETYVREYHSILDLLAQATKADLSNFRVPAEQVRPVITSFNYVTGKKNFSSANFCERAFLMMKIDGILMLFDISSQKIKIGFKP